MEVTAGKVRELRARSGAGVMECRNALERAGADVERAEALLRAELRAIAEARADRGTREGRVFFGRRGSAAVLLELRCETDFVARNDEFLSLGSRCLELALNSGSTFSPDLLEEEIVAARARFRELIAPGRIAMLEDPRECCLAGYLHGDTARLGSLVRIGTGRDGGKGATPAAEKVLGEISGELALQIVAGAPKFISEELIPGDLRETTLAGFRREARLLGKKEQLVEKIAAGRWTKYVGQNCLISQRFFRDDSLSVAAWLSGAAASVGVPIDITGFAYANVADPLP